MSQPQNLTATINDDRTVTFNWEDPDTSNDTNESIQVWTGNDPDNLINLLLPPGTLTFTTPPLHKNGWWNAYVTSLFPTGDPANPNGSTATPWIKFHITGA